MDPASEYPETAAPAAPAPSAVEWPTVMVFLGSLGLVAAAVMTHDAAPLPVTLSLLAIGSTWYGSFQHEVVHGHPTPSPVANLMLGSVPLSFLMPFWMYRDTHLVHHTDDMLTDPYADPESYYVSPEQWATAGPIQRSLWKFRRTLAGRLIVGPALSVIWVWSHLVVSREWARIVRWVVGCALLLLLVRQAGLPMWQFLLGAGYLGTSLTMVRSFAEHRSGPVGQRTAIVRSNWFFSLLYLNNNLHVTHHRMPGLSWYRLPDAVSSDDLAIAEHGAGLYRGYGQIARAYLVRRFCQPVHPLMANADS